LDDAIAALKAAIKANEITEENVAAARKRVAKARKDFAAASKHAHDTALLVPKHAPKKKDLDKIIKAKKPVVKAPVKAKSAKKAAVKKSAVKKSATKPVVAKAAAHASATGGAALKKA
jgi:DnaK suppressor protein